MGKYSRNWTRQELALSADEVSAERERIRAAIENGEKSEADASEELDPLNELACLYEFGRGEFPPGFSFGWRAKYGVPDYMGYWELSVPGSDRTSINCEVWTKPYFFSKDHKTTALVFALQDAWDLYKLAKAICGLPDE